MTSRLEQAIGIATQGTDRFDLHLASSKGEWVCSVQRSAGGRYRLSMKPDPVEAVLEALGYSDNTPH